MFETLAYCFTSSTGIKKNAPIKINIDDFMWWKKIFCTCTLNMQCECALITLCSLVDGLSSDIIVFNLLTNSLNSFSTYISLYNNPHVRTEVPKTFGNLNQLIKNAQPFSISLIDGWMETINDSLKSIQYEG